MRLMVMIMGAVIAIGGTAKANDVQVPFVGCKSDGQTDALPPPKDNHHAPNLPAPLASRLAWYASNNSGGVLAPRGWTCFELYGSDGSVFMVTPSGFGRDPFTAKLSGPAIQVSISFGDTSGRFEAAKIAARLFPKRKPFVDSVIREGIEPKKDFVFDPFPNDRINRFSRDAVAFETPANKNGMGTMSRLLKSSDPIHGLIWMDNDNNATMLAVRLSSSQEDLAAYIVNAMKPH